MKQYGPHNVGFRRNWDGKLIDIPRASGDCICDFCKKPYKDHPLDIRELAYDGQPYLHLLCDGQLVKL